MEEINFIRPEEVYNRNTGESKVRYRSYDGNDRFIPVVEGEDGVPKTLIEVTWQELKNKRDASKLTPGALYRITDYQCTTTQVNTRSAGHQFDIVLLALSENKLAEEGWAMMHDNIYDVTFADGVTKKCYLYFFDDDSDCNIVLAEDITKGHNLGIGPEDFPKIDKINKTAELGLSYYDDEHGDGFITIAEPNVQYNYFQNSNLSAWKVWYCLDNDTARFAWADDSVDDKTHITVDTQLEPDGPIVTITLERRPEEDITVNSVNYYAWNDDSVESAIYTKSEIPNIGDELYGYIPGTGIVTTRVTVKDVLLPTNTPHGRGVIYRLIDEWNNDVPYDFKNIQLYLPIVEGKYDSDGEKSWVYTFCLYNEDEGTYEDGSLKIIEVSVDDTYVVFSNIFMSANFDARKQHRIVFNVALGYYSLSNEEGSAPNDCIYVSCKYAVITDSYVFLYYCVIKDFVAQSRGIYYYSKKVLTES